MRAWVKAIYMVKFLCIIDREVEVEETEPREKNSSQKS